MSVQSCIPVIPSSDLERSHRLWVEGLGFAVRSEMHRKGKLAFCMLQKGDLVFMLNRRAGEAVKSEKFEGIRLYWGASDVNDLSDTREWLKSLGFGVSPLRERDYGQTEFTLVDDDGYSHCFGAPTRTLSEAGA